MLKDLFHGVDGSLTASLLARAHTCRAPVACWTSVPVMANMALPLMRHSTSPIPSGRAPGCLSRATRLQDVKACNPTRSTDWQICLATVATASQKAVVTLFERILGGNSSHKCQSPMVQLLHLSLRPLNGWGWHQFCQIIGCGVCGVVLGSTTAEFLSGCPQGCFGISKLCTDACSSLLSPTVTWLSKLSIPPLLWLARRQIAGLTLPSNISLEKDLASCSSDLACQGAGKKLLWMVRPSCRSCSMSPSYHAFILHSRQVTRSFALED